MKIGITNPDISADNAHSKRDPVQGTLLVAMTIVLLGVFAAFASIAFTGKNWFSAQYTALLAISSILLLGTIAAQRQDNHPPKTRRTRTHHNDEIANQIAWTALRPYASGESRNCKISQRSTSSRLVFSPILSFQYTALVVAATVLSFLLKSTLTASLPQSFRSGVAATSDPLFTTFIFLFSCTVVCCVAWLLRKPVRSLEFNKNLGVFWIEKHRVFGWKVGESAQMPISQIHALQIISYSKRDTKQHSRTQSRQPDEIHFESIPSCQEQDDKKHLVRDYEVNVVFRNRERVNIISHCNCRAIKHDTEILASFLGVPIWDQPPATKQG